MNRTGIFLGVAGVLALVALVVGLPRAGGTTTTPPVVEAPPIVSPPPSTSSNGSLSITTRLSHPFVMIGTNDVYLTADIKAVEQKGSGRSPVNLALVIDRSGSMSGFKLNQAKQAARTLVGQLRSEDRLTIVHYGSDVKAMEGIFATPENHDRLLAYIDGIWDDGGTNIGAGLSTGRDLLLKAKHDFKVNRMVLISDGQPTEGITDHASLINIVRDVRQSGISVSSIGVGTDFNEQLMESFAEVGAGAYAYLQDAAQLQQIFQKDLNAAGTQVARNVTITVKVPAGARLVRTLGYTPIARSTSGAEELVTIALPDFAAGTSERVVLQLSVDGTSDGAAVDVSQLTLAYTDLLASQPVTTNALVRATVTGNSSVVQQNQDGEALVFAARAQAGANTQAAVDALRKGDRVQARQLFEANKKIINGSGSVAGAPSVADDLQEQDKLIQGLDSANDEGSINSYSKDARKKARLNFGLFGSTY
ncbi:MAG: VWA domain-containing protein [Myxococcales bacterium]|nr:VWA domain-containing protein [Myxococcales bacterium]